MKKRPMDPKGTEKKEQDYIKLTSVDWTDIPTISELKSHIKIAMATYEPEEKIATFFNRQPFSLNSDDYLIHVGHDKNALKKMYEEHGFETNLILQYPLGHKGPTVACPIGFPFNLPDKYHYPDLQRYNRWICRLHVDIASSNSELVSIPHIEPDPLFHPADHLKDTFFGGNTVRGKEAVDILKKFLGTE